MNIYEVMISKPTMLIERFYGSRKAAERCAKKVLKKIYRKNKDRVVYILRA